MSLIPYDAIAVEIARIFLHKRARNIPNQPFNNLAITLLFRKDGRTRALVSPERSAPRKRSLEVCAPPHPQQNGNNAQIAAAAWLGFANPNPCRTTSPMAKSTTHLPSVALDGHYQILSYQNRLRPSLPAHLQTSLLHPRAIAPNVPKSHPLHSATSQYVWTQGFACCIRKQTN